MPRTQRSPPQPKQKSISPKHYASDPVINRELDIEDQDCLNNITRRLKRKLLESPGHLDSSLEERLDKLQSHQDKKFDILTDAISTLIEQNNQIKKSMEFMSAQYDTLLTKVNTLEQDNLNYKSQVQVLEKKLDSLERDSRSTSIEIRNIPIAENENKQALTSTVKNICSIIGSTPVLQDLELRHTYRSRSNAIVAEFTTTARKDSVISNFRAYNKNKREKKEDQFNTLSLGLPGTARPVYISDFLTSKNRHIFYLAREQVKSKKLVAAWTSYGKIFVKKLEGEPARRLNSERDLETLV